MSWVQVSDQKLAAPEFMQENVVAVHHWNKSQIAAPSDTETEIFS
jgi:hypothetical protein